MHSTYRFVFAAVVLTCCSACEGPFLFAPGGALSGTAAEVPATWTLDEGYGFAELETRPEDPYSINLAYVQLGGRLYIYAGNTRTQWVMHIEQNPFVRLRLGEVIYSLRAERVDDDDELAAFAAEWTSRSIFQRDPMQFDEVWLYRLTARS